MVDKEDLIKGLECCASGSCMWCTYFRKDHCLTTLEKDVLELLKEQQKTIVSLQHTIDVLNKGIAEQAKEPVKPTADKYGNAHCICGETVGFISHDKTPWKICLNYCHYCGRKLVWEAVDPDADEG